MTGLAAAYAWNDRSITGQSSGVFSWGGETTLNAGGSWSGSRTRTLNFNGSSGFSGYTSSAGSHDHSRGTIGNSMTGYFDLRPNCHGDTSGVFSTGQTGSRTVIYGSNDGSTFLRHYFNGSSGFSGCLLLRGTICSL